MSIRKTLQELTIKDNFMFAAVMMDPENCRRLLELVLEIPIEKVTIDREKSLIYHPEYKGVRLDVYASDDKNSHYNVEMQVQSKKIERRTRYYHSQMDMELLQSGVDYDELPDSYVIFICDFDPIGKKKYRYTQRKSYVEVSELEIRDGSYSIYLSTKGENPEDVPEELVKFLKYVAAGLKESQENYEDDFIFRLQKTVGQIKQSREMGGRYMLLEEMLRMERKEGREEGRVEGMTENILMFLSELGSIPESLRSKILAINNLSELSRLTRAAAKAGSIEEFEKMMNCQN